LSQDWFTAAHAAVQVNEASAPPTRLTIDQRVGEQIRYRVVIERDACSIAPIKDSHEVDAADAVFDQEMHTAVSIAQGYTDAHQAFLLGHIRYCGNVNVLIERRDAFEWLQAALAPLMATTSFD